MDLVNVVYRYINKFINSEKLVKQLKKINSEEYSKQEKAIIERLILDIQDIRENIPNEIDEIEKRRIENINKMLKMFEASKEKTETDKDLEFINERYNQLVKEKEITKDGGKLYNEIVKMLTNNTLYIDYAKKMTTMELLEFITQYISVPLPPQITQDTFDDLVKAGIKEDKREALWRLAVNYNHKNKDFSKIEDYFIQVRDAWYLIELMSAVGEDLNIDKLIDTIALTNDKKFIKEVIEKGNDIYIFEEELNKLKNLK